MISIEDAMRVQTKEEARAILEDYVAEILKARRTTRRIARKIAKRNIGYFAGYTDAETAERVWRLFGTRHPVFGRRWPSPRRAFELGIKWGRRQRLRARAPSA